MTDTSHPQASQASQEKKTRKAHTRRAHTSALENASSIAQLIRAGQELPFLLPVPFTEQGKATNLCMETHKARLEIFVQLPEEEKPFYTWALRKVEMEGVWWIEVGPQTGRQRKTSASARAFSEALRLAAERTRPAQAEDAPSPPRTTDDVLKQHGYF